MTATVVRVGEIAQQLRGVTYSKGDASTAPLPGFVPILRAGNISDEGLNFADLVYVPACRVSTKQMLTRHDVVIAASSGSLEVVGKAAQLVDGFEGSFGAFCKVLRPNGRVNPRYFLHFFKTRDYRRRISSLAEGANINNLRAEHLDNLELPLPSMDRQEQLADVLDRADALCVKRREALAHLDELAQSTFLDMFGDPAKRDRGWGVVKVGDLLDSATYGTGEKARGAGDIPVLRMNNVTPTGELDLTDLKYLDRSSVDERHIVRRGDLLFNRTNSSELVGKTGLYRLDDPAAFAGYLVRLRVNSQNDPEYLAVFLNSRYAKRVLRNMCKSIIGMANINARVSIW